MEKPKVEGFIPKIETLQNSIQKDINAHNFRNYESYLTRYNRLARQLNGIDGFGDIICIPDLPNRDKGMRNSQSAAEQTKIYEIEAACQTLLSLMPEQTKESSDRKSMLTNERLVFGVGIIFVIIMMVLAILFPEPTSFQYTVFRVVLALASAGVAAILPGFIEVKLQKWLRAGGAIAVFVVVYFFSPAALVSQQPTKHSPTDNNNIKEIHREDS